MIKDSILISRKTNSSQSHVYRVLSGERYSPKTLAAAQAVLGLTDGQMRRRYPAAYKCKPPVKGTYSKQVLFAKHGTRPKLYKRNVWKEIARRIGCSRAMLVRVLAGESVSDRVMNGFVEYVQSKNYENDVFLMAGKKIGMAGLI